MRVGKTLRRAVRLFTRPNCGLCAEAKLQIDAAAQSVEFSYSEIDITMPENTKWYDKYAFDVPVLHVQQSPNSEPYKIYMHRLQAHELVEAINDKKAL